MDIVNIVLSGDLGRPADLNLFSKSLDNFDYQPERYHGGYLRLGGCSATIYRSGKYIVPGVKSFEEAESVLPKMKSILSDLIDISLMKEPIIRNIVATEESGRPLKLPDLAIHLMNSNYLPSYEPESFPGLILQTDKGTINVFSSGKYVLLGTDNKESLNALNELFLEILDGFM